MRAIALLGLACLGLASCDSPYGTDFSKPVSQNYALSTGGHIKGATTSSNVSSASGTALSSVTGGSSSSRIQGAPGS
jgi:hypothetical protein